MIRAIDILQTVSEAMVKPVNADLLLRVLSKIAEDRLGLTIGTEFRQKAQVVLHYSPVVSTLDIHVSTGDTFKDTKRLYDILKEKISRYGWYIEERSVELKRGLVTLYPNYDERITDIPAFLYHFADPSDVDEILRRGLIPTEGKASDWHDHSYPPRVFLTLEPELEKPGKAILKIDTRKLRSGTKFYKDHRWTLDSVWTPTHIPPEAITFEEETPEDDYDDWDDE